jgi:hypothetical protein
MHLKFTQLKQFSGLWRHIVCWNFTDISEEPTASIFGVKE